MEDVQSVIIATMCDPFFPRLDLHRFFRGPPRRLLNVACTFNLLLCFRGVLCVEFGIFVEVVNVATLKNCS